VQGRLGLPRRVSPRRGSEHPAPHAGRALLLERVSGIVTREAGPRRGNPRRVSASSTSSPALETLGVARRGYFVEGLGVSEFALLPARSRAGLRAAARRTTRRRRSCSPPPTRRSPTARVCSGPTRRARPPRQAGAYVVLAGAEPVLFVERGGKGLQVLVDADDPRIEPSLAALAEPSSAAASSGSRSSGRRRARRGLAVRRTADRAGFRRGPRKLTLYDFSGGCA
jgi:ATP-dependent Lhr-like helicase